VTCPKFNVRGYPTLILLQDGKVSAQYNGKRELGDLIEFVTASLNEQKTEVYTAVKCGNTDR